MIQLIIIKPTLFYFILFFPFFSSFIFIMNYQFIPSSPSSSVSSQDANQSPRTSFSSSCSHYKRYSEPQVAVTTIRRWDDSQLEMELAEDNIIINKTSHQRTTSLCFNKKKKTFYSQQNIPLFKKIRNWLF
ncbi:uncharacterized protein BX663DRAFT_510072 [Cokeromyces recurvatus]|uniref:uncharacterized protein n=1 Tax=Cokeromyces recurvatus TaxID=90255 RepID=UPI00221EEE55|nr:uncharacterized protein BX663DRAFT_510072 [Cokeromyces recurvatus]KAI7902669.1 hypothetical protein BX663DRAFT_510072 [Cokeromyces recurvatus]